MKCERKCVVLVNSMESVINQIKHGALRLNGKRIFIQKDYLITPLHQWRRKSDCPLLKRREEKVRTQSTAEVSLSDHYAKDSHGHHHQRQSTTTTEETAWGDW